VADEGAVVEPPSRIMVGRHVVAEHVYASDGPSFFGQASQIYSAILPPGTAVPLKGDYVRASADVFEVMIPPRAKTAVERLLWRAGWLVRRDVHEAVLAAHALTVAEGTVSQAPPAQFAPGEDKPAAVAVALGAVAGLDSPPPPPVSGAPAPA
jgi:hypothetical protein